MLTFQKFQQQTDQKPKFTGKRLVMLDSKATHKAITTHAKSASLKLASFSDYSEGVKDFHKAFDEADGIVFEQFGVAVINEDKEKQVSMLTESSSSKILSFIQNPKGMFTHCLIPLKNL